MAAQGGLVMIRHDQARARLAAWEAFKPSNFYHDDRYLQVALAARMGRERREEAAPVVGQAGTDSAGVISRACAELDKFEHLPPLEGWSPIGERTSVFLMSSVTARRFYERNGYARSGEPKSVYGLRSAYPMSKRIA
jgi:hypothetical protein